DAQRRMSLGMRIASLLGAIALSAAVFLFFYRIWGALSTSTQVALLAAAPAVAIALTEFAHRADRTRHFVFIGAVIACACMVLDLMMIGDIFAMNDSSNAFAVWAAFALAIGYAYTLRLPVAAGIGCAMVFAAGTVLASRGVDWTAFIQRPETFIPLGGVTFAGGMVISG